MPNEKELSRAAARRAARKAKQEAHACAAKEQDQTLRVDKDKQAAALAAEAARVQQERSSPTPPKKKTRAQITREARIAAEKQAAVEALRKPEPVADRFAPGDEIPLHVLNQRARQADAEARDMATEVGKQIGQYARDVVSTRVPKRSAFQRRYDMEARAAGADLQAKQLKQGA